MFATLISVFLALCVGASIIFVMADILWKRAYTVPRKRYLNIAAIFFIVALLGSSVVYFTFK